MSVVCNSSVLIALSTIGQLRLLRERFKNKELVIPKAVLREVVEEGRDQPGAQEVETALDCCQAGKGPSYGPAARG